MNAVIRQHSWKKQLTEFSETNSTRPSRLGVFEPSGDGFIDYWLADGLPFVGVVVEIHEGRATVNIMLQDISHSVHDARKVEFHSSFDGTEDGLNVIDADGRTTLLRFEGPAPKD